MNNRFSKQLYLIAMQDQHIKTYRDSLLSIALKLFQF